MNERKRADALIKSLPADTPLTIRNAIKIARMRFDAARLTGQDTAPIVAEIEQRVEQALAIEKKKQRMANKPRPVVQASMETETAPPAPPPPPAEEITMPTEFLDWTFIPITTTDRISIGAPVAFSADDQTFANAVHDQYLFDAREKFERTPLLVDGCLIDAGGWAATFDALDFVKSFGKHYALFVTNVFLARLTRLTKYEETTRKTANDFRRIRATTMERWTAGLTLFLHGAERALADKNELLVNARARLNDLALDRLYDAKTGRLKFRTIAHTDAQTAAENKLAEILVAETRHRATSADVEMLRVLWRNLKLSPAVLTIMAALLTKLGRTAETPPHPGHIEKQKLANDLVELLPSDPLLIAVKARLRLPDKIAQNPFTLFRWLIELTEKTRAANMDVATNFLMLLGLGLTDARNLTEALALRQTVVAKRLNTAAGGKLGSVFLTKVDNALTRLRRPRLRFALVEFTESTLKHFSGAADKHRHVDDRFKSTTSYFVRTDALLDRFMRALPIETSDVRRYVLESAGQEKIIAQRLAAGFQRFDQMSRLAGDLGRHLSTLLTEEEKNKTNAADWFRETFQVNDATWHEILAAYDLPGLAAAPKDARAAFENCRAKTVQANIWSIVDNVRGYPFASAAMASLRQRAHEGKIEILHNMAAADIDVSPFCGEINTRVEELTRRVGGATALPPSVLDALVTHISNAIVDRQIVARHWPQWTTKRTAFLVRANEMLVQSGKPAPVREKTLRSFINFKSSHWPRLLNKLTKTN